MKEQFEIKWEQNDLGIEVSQPTEVDKHLYKFYIHHPGHKYLDDISMSIGMGNFLEFVIVVHKDDSREAERDFTMSKFSIVGLTESSDVIMHYEGIRYGTCVYLILDDATDVKGARWETNDLRD